MASSSVAPSAHPSTRELRGIALYRQHAADIRHEDGTWFVPSGNDSTTVYEVHLVRRGEYCECRDFEFRGSEAACKHIYCAVIAKAKTAPCSMCGKRYKHRELHEVPEGNLSCFEGDLLCKGCAADHGVA